MPLPVQSNGEKVDPATREAERFEGFYQGILEMNDVLERIEQFAIKRRMREIISRLEGNIVAHLFTLSSVFALFCALLCSF